MVVGFDWNHYQKEKSNLCYFQRSISYYKYQWFKTYSIEKYPKVTKARVCFCQRGGSHSIEKTIKESQAMVHKYNKFCMG